jgi:hypothetical protein
LSRHGVSSGRRQHLFGRELFANSGAGQRIMADGLSCQQQMMAVTGALASPPLTPSASVKEVEPA